MSKSNKLTVFILVAMAMGILIGAILHKNATGKELTYTPNKDFIGQETISMDYGESDPREFTIYTVSNSATQKYLSIVWERMPL